MVIFKWSIKKKKIFLYIEKHMGDPFDDSND